MSFNFWHMTDKKASPIKNGSGFINIDFYARVTGGGSQFPRIFIDFPRQKFNTIISRATNRAGEHFRTIMLRSTAETYYVKQKDVRDSLTLRRAYGRDSFNFTLISRGKRRILAHYIQNPKVNPGHKLEAWEFAGAVKRAGGLKKFRSAFFMNKGSHTVYIRKNNRPEQVMSPSIPQLMKNQRNVEEATIEAQKVFEKRLRHELATQWGLTP